MLRSTWKFSNLGLSALFAVLTLFAGSRDAAAVVVVIDGKIMSAAEYQASSPTGESTAQNDGPQPVVCAGCPAIPSDPGDPLSTDEQQVLAFFNAVFEGFYGVDVDDPSDGTADPDPRFMRANHIISDLGAADAQGGCSAAAPTLLSAFAALVLWRRRRG
jgi:hypothetical protein